MGVSTDAILCCGVSFPEDFTFPWDDTEGEDDGEPEEWWRRVNGYVEHPKVDWSNYEEDRVKPEWKATYREMKANKDAFDSEHPMPFEVVRHCSGEYTMYILAIPATVTTASIGSPEIIVPSELSTSLPLVGEFQAFLQEYIAPTLEDEDPPGEEIDLETVHWYLCSYGS